MPEIQWKVCPRCAEKGIKWIGDKHWDCSHCGYRLYFNVAAATALFIEYRGQLLVLRRNKEPGLGLLDLPGGFVDPGESAEEALSREIQEELGISVGSLEYLFSLPNRYLYKEVEYRTCDLFYTASIDALPQFFEKDEISEVLLINPQAISLKDFAFSSVQNAVKRYRDRNLNKS